LGDAIRDVDLNFAVTQTNFNRRVAAADEVDAVKAVYDVGNTTLDQLLDAQRRHAEADSAYYRSLLDYNRAIMRVHHRKGSLLEYNGVYLAEGPWPGKAYFDTLRRARQRDASTYLDYGFTRPNVISRGPVEQITHPSSSQADVPTRADEGFEFQETVPHENTQPEVIPAPEQIETTEPTLDATTSGNSLAALPFVGQVEPAFATAQTDRLRIPQYESQHEPQRAALPVQTLLPHNPYRNELANWNEESAIGAPNELPPVNPLRHSKLTPLESFNWIRQQQAPSDETTTGRTTSETPADAADR